MFYRAWFLYRGQNDMSRVVGAVDRLDRSVTALSPVVVTAFGIFSLYYVAFSYGLFVIALAGGKRGITSVVANSGNNPGVFLICLPLIPVGLVFLEAADLEGRGLGYWRAKVSPLLSRIPILGRVINYWWPTPPREPHVSPPSGLSSSIDFLARSVSGGLMLPVVAYYIGRAAFKKTSSVHQIILGGLLFYTLKVTLKMYLKQQQFLRQGSRRVLNYDSSKDPDSNDTN